MPTTPRIVPLRKLIGSATVKGNIQPKRPPQIIATIAAMHVFIESPCVLNKTTTNPHNRAKELSGRTSVVNRACSPDSAICEMPS
jgi:hypothetical protein